MLGRTYLIGMFFHNNNHIGQGGSGFKALQETTNQPSNTYKYTTKNVTSKMVCLFNHAHNSQEISCWLCPLGG
jgi:hypothetical protein